MRYRITIAVVFSLALSLGLLILAGMQPGRVSAAPLRQASCTLPATVTTADQLYDCITAANARRGRTPSPWARTST